MKKLPRWVQWVLILTNRYKNRQIILGDFEEFYNEIINEAGLCHAHLWCWKQVLKSIPRFIATTCYWKTALLTQYLRIALRHVVKHRVYSIINISGLAIGMACCIVLSLWIRDELTFDRFHKNAARLCRIISHNQYGDRFLLTPNSPAPLGDALKREYPDVVETVRYDDISGFWPVRYNGIVFMGVHIGLSDPPFFRMFSFPFIKGNPTKALEDKHSVVITEALSEKIFGNTDALGKCLQISNQEYTVTGIIKNIPVNSHLQFDCMIPFKIFEDWPGVISWKNFGTRTYLMMRHHYSKELFEDRIKNYLKHHIPETSNQLGIQPLLSIHLHSEGFKNDNAYAVTGQIKVVYFESLNLQYPFQDYLFLP